MLVQLDDQPNFWLCFHKSIQDWHFRLTTPEACHSLWMTSLCLAAGFSLACTYLTLQSVKAPGMAGFCNRAASLELNPRPHTNSAADREKKKLSVHPTSPGNGKITSCTQHQFLTYTEQNSSRNNSKPKELQQPTEALPPYPKVKVS